MFSTRRLSPYDLARALDVFESAARAKRESVNRLRLATGAFAEIDSGIVEVLAHELAIEAQGFDRLSETIEALKAEHERRAKDGR